LFVVAGADSHLGASFRELSRKNQPKPTRAPGERTTSL
jgi:hypothetical protein